MKRWLAFLLAGTLAFSTLSVSAAAVNGSTAPTDVAAETENVEPVDTTESEQEVEEEATESAASNTEEEDGVVPEQTEDKGSVTISVKDSIELVIGETQTLEAEVETTGSVSGITDSGLTEESGIAAANALASDDSVQAGAASAITWFSEDESVATVDAQTGEVTAVGEGETNIVATVIENGVTYTATTAVVVTTPHVYYTTHVQNIGWQSYVSDGTLAGTAGKALRLEAIKIYLTDVPSDSGITYSTHVQNIGWQDYVSDAAVSGTSGKALRLEAIRISLYGSIADTYDVYYRVHAQNIGWMGWAKNGASAGTAGYGYRLEGIQIRLVKKGEAAPGSTVRPYSTVAWSQDASGNWYYKIDGTPVTGWQTISSKKYYFNAAGVMQKGWLTYNSKQYYLGTNGVMVTGWQIIDNVRYYFYTDGSMAVSTTIDGYVIGADGKAVASDAMTQKAQGYSSNTNYLVMVNKSTHKMGIYQGSKGKWTLVKGFWTVSTGAKATPTPSGTFKMSKPNTKRSSTYGWLDFDHSSAAYCYDVSAGFWVHTILLKKGSRGNPYKTKVVDSRLGYNISHSCIRLAIANCDWVYHNIPRGTKLVVY